MSYTKSSIKKLGSRIRQEFATSGISPENLELLHEYRISYKEPMAEIFDTLTEVSKSIQKGDVRTYRIKRIESIVSKLIREPNMGLLEMGDIAGCRVIVNNEKHIPKIVEILKQRLDIEYERDYINNPKKNGYRSHHLMIRPNNTDGFKRLIEVQIRSIEQHNWATLVEITDQMYKVRVKEGEVHEQLQRFHFLRSKSLNELKIEEIEEILTIERNLKIYKKIVSAIVNNYVKIRSAWLRHESENKSAYFILEVDETYETTIEAFEHFKKAEEAYINKSKNSGNNVVLTHIDNPNFKKISTAYSNYVLTFHNYEEEIFNILQELLLYSSSNEDKRMHKKYLNYAVELYDSTNKHLIRSIDKLKQTNYPKERIDEWLDEIEERLIKLKKILGRIEEIKKPKTSLEKVIDFFNS